MTEQLHFHLSLSCIGEGNGNPLQCSCLENPRDGGAWWATVYGVTQSRTRLKWLSSSSSRLVIVFLPRSKCLLISWLQSPSAVILEPQKIKSLTVSPSICHEVMGPDAMIFNFWMLGFKPTFSLSSFTFIRRLFDFCHDFWGYWYFSQHSWFQLVLHPAQRFSWCTLHINKISTVTIYTYSFPDLEPVCCSMSSFNCCFLTCIQKRSKAQKSAF